MLFFNDFTECGIVPVKSGHLHYNTKCEVATRVTLRERQVPEQFPVVTFLPFLLIFFPPGIQKPFNIFVLKCLGKFNFWTLLHCKPFWFGGRQNSVLYMIVSNHPKCNA